MRIEEEVKLSYTLCDKIFNIAVYEARGHIKVERKIHMGQETLIFWFKKKKNIQKGLTKKLSVESMF